MSKSIPTIQKYMTTAPHSIGAEQTIAVASAMMHEHNFRHLPVLHGGKLLGMLTDRDIKLITSFSGVDSSEFLVEDAMTDEPYSVSPEAPLDEVVSEMAEKKFGSALIVQNRKVVGIFTAVDACRTLAELLSTRLKK